jgi:aryl-alcohol dehydrogenase-like predicted oxidoreductase
MDRVDFGHTGLQVSRLCFGTGTHGWGGRSQQTALGLDGLSTLLRQAHDWGINFWDAADQYGSHPHLARALRGLRRDSVVIATKTSARRCGRVARDVERFLRELNTDVLDIVLLHCVTGRDWPRRYADAMGALSRAKEAGKVRAVGFSCHSLEALSAAVESDWVEVVLVRINPAGVNMDASPADVVPLIERLYTSGKALYGMKVLGCGRLVHDARATVEYALGLGTVHALNIGMTSREQLHQNLTLVDQLAPLNPLRQVQAARA